MSSCAVFKVISAANMELFCPKKTVRELIEFYEQNCRNTERNQLKKFYILKLSKSNSPISLDSGYSSHKASYPYVQPFLERHQSESSIFISHSIKEMVNTHSMPNFLGLLSSSSTAAGSNSVSSSTEAILINSDSADSTTSINSKTALLEPDQSAEISDGNSSDSESMGSTVARTVSLEFFDSTDDEKENHYARIGIGKLQEIPGMGECSKDEFIKHLHLASSNSLDSLWTENSYISGPELPQLQLRESVPTKFRISDICRDMLPLPASEEPDRCAPSPIGRLDDLRQKIRWTLDASYQIIPEMKTLKIKMDLFTLEAQYEKMLNVDEEDLITSSSNTASLILTEMTYLNLENMRDRQFFILVSSGIRVLCSKMARIMRGVLYFPDKFVFAFSPPDVTIKVQLFSNKPYTKLGAVLRRELKKCCCPLICGSSDQEKKPHPDFDLVDELIITHQDLRDNVINTLRCKTSGKRMYQFSLEIDEVQLRKSKRGFIRFRVLDQGTLVYKEFWAVLSSGQFQIFENRFYTIPYKSFDLRYCMQTEADTNGNLRLRSVRPQTAGDEGRLPVLESREHFVVETFFFHATSPNETLDWEEAINDVINALEHWKLSFFTSRRLD